MKTSQGRQHLTLDEVKSLAAAASKLGRHGSRDALMIRMAFRHGLRCTELVNLRRDQVDLDRGVLHVRRAKKGTPSTHPLDGEHIRALRKLFREYPTSPYVFVTERGTPMVENGFYKIVQRAGVAAELPLAVHPHMLRHGTGFHLANSGQDTRAIQAYLGHRNIQHTVLYTALAEGRFDGFWKD